MIKEKKCFKCEELKLLSEFYKHAGNSDGHLNKCKSCTKNDTKLRFNKLSLNDEWLDLERARHREKYYRLEYKEKHKPSNEIRERNMKKYYDKYPEKKKAKSSMGNMKCLNKTNEFHHWSYNDEHFKDVIELNFKIHKLVHRFIKYDQSFKMYRDRLGNLLDTKEKHQQYINYIIEINN